MIERCPWCTGKPALQFTAREMMFGLREPFTYLRCQDCGSLWLADPPADLAAYYGDGYYSMADDLKSAERSAAAAVWVRILLKLPPRLLIRTAGQRGVPRYTGWIAGLDVGLRSRIADIGCGEAGVIWQMSRHGFTDLWGFDPYIASDKEAGNAHYRRASITSVDSSFDVIMFNHALEHVDNPILALRGAASRLKLGGALIVRVPVAGSWADLHYGRHWVALDPPRHLAVPSQPGMHAAAAAAGLRARRVFFDSGALQFWASEQYAQDIALHDGKRCDAAVLKTLDRQARELNARREGDTAGYVLTRS